VGEVVVIRVNAINDLGANVSLLEYGGVDAFIHPRNLDMYRVIISRLKTRMFRIGRTLYAVVRHIDTEKGQIDLICDHVDGDRLMWEDIREVEARFTMSKQVHSILSHVASTCERTLEEMYQLFGWDLQKRFGHALRAFSQIATGDSSCLDEYNLPEAVRSTLVETIQHRVTPFDEDEDEDDEYVEEEEPIDSYIFW